MSKEFFPPQPEATPTIYAYESTHPQHKGMLKIGYTTHDAATRVAQQFPIKTPGKPTYCIVLEESAIRDDGTVFTDRDVHRYLRDGKVKHAAGEWYVCGVKEVRAAINALRERKRYELARDQSFKPRPEQQAAVEKAAEYFKRAKSEGGRVPHFLWNAKMRFGKTFATYQLAKKMGWKRLLVLTFKPAVESAWEEDLKSHIDFEGWQFVSRDVLLRGGKPQRRKPLVCFGSFQDYLQPKTLIRGIKTFVPKDRNLWVHKLNWDCIVFDEYHYGAWRDRAKSLFEEEEEGEVEQEFTSDEQKIFEEETLPITTSHYLYLSGTPFRAIATGEFLEEQIYNWTYSDEQRAKTKWKGAKNPYTSLPRMVLMTYKLPENIRQIALKGEFEEFDLNVFFSAEGEGDNARFIYEEYVQKWLDLIRGQFSETLIDDLKMGSRKPAMPFSHVPLRNLLNHTVWFLPRVNSCFAMRNLLEQPQNIFYHEYKVVVCAGSGVGIGNQALPPVYAAMGDPLTSKTITLSCGKLMTGVTVRPWTGIFMLRSTSSPETYFQAAFRVQTPWTIKNPDGNSPNKEEIIKNECYVLDFAPNRALRQVAEYSSRLNTDERDDEKKVAEFIQFLPVIAYDGFTMHQIDAAGVLEMAMSGSTATLLARRWQAAVLVNVDNDTLRKLMANQDALAALEKIEEFRALNQDIQTIINKSDAIKKAKTKANQKDLTAKEKKQLKEDEKELKSKREEIRRKLLKFATRVPVFMYLTDYRERSLKDVIAELEPELFRKVTGLEKKDFELMVSLNLFNETKMNEAVFGFKRYEDASLAYTGVYKHKDMPVGGFSTVLQRPEFDEVFVNRQEVPGI
ncbi:MAG TPA: hypothetical protein VJU84_00990 [Pyrinomonadaceae bacterium]|nr:hypothetical protein [Pyrinomonadaceae bacterium]